MALKLRRTTTFGADETPPSCVRGREGSWRRLFHPSCWSDGVRQRVPMLSSPASAWSAIETKETETTTGVTRPSSLIKTEDGVRDGESILCRKPGKGEAPDAATCPRAVVAQPKLPHDHASNERASLYRFSLCLLLCYPGRPNHRWCWGCLESSSHARPPTVPPSSRQQFVLLHRSPYS